MDMSGLLMNPAAGQKLGTENPQEETDNRRQKMQCHRHVPVHEIDCQLNVVAGLSGGEHLSPGQIGIGIHEAPGCCQQHAEAQPLCNRNFVAHLQFPQSNRIILPIRHCGKHRLSEKQKKALRRGLVLTIISAADHLPQQLPRQTSAGSPPFPDQGQPTGYPCPSSA